MHSAFLKLLHEDGRTVMYKGTRRHIFVTFFPEIPQAVTEWMYIVGVWCYKGTEWLFCWVCCCTVYWVYRECTVCSWTVLTAITQKLLLHVQQHNSTAHLLYKYCTNCTVCNWTVLTVITQMLLLHVQLHNRRETAKLMSSDVDCRLLFEII